MLFLNPFLLLGLVGVAIPVIIHLFNRKSALTTDWGAMQFLFTDEGIGEMAYQGPEAYGEYREPIDRLIQLALEEHDARSRLITTGY